MFRAPRQASMTSVHAAFTTRSARPGLPDPRMVLRCRTVIEVPEASGRVGAHLGPMSVQARQEAPHTTGPEAAIVVALGVRSVVLVGMMGAGKSSIGRRLAARLLIPFADADTEIETAHDRMSIADIFSTYGEGYFRAGEMRV